MSSFIRAWSPVRRFRCGLVACLVGGGAVSGSAQPKHVYSTLDTEPETAFTFHYHSGREAVLSEIRYDTQSRQGLSSAYRYRTAGSSVELPYGDGRRIHHVRVQKLEPDTTYFFVAGDTVGGFSPEGTFKTLPEDPERIRVVAGGDIGVSKDVRLLFRAAARQQPDIMIWGGDLAYAEGRHLAMWDLLLGYLEQDIHKPMGRLLPLVVAMGNHDNRIGWGATRKDAPYYYHFFRPGGALSYFSHRIGNRLGVVVLDSGHTAAYAGVQQEFLRTALTEMKDLPFTVATYHVPMYPAHRPYAEDDPGRRAWQPLFDEFHLDAALEQHDHTFQRTHSIVSNMINTAGTVYLGAGCLGRPARALIGKRWYQAKAKSLQHFWLLDVYPDRMECRALNKQGKVFDETVISNQRLLAPATLP